METLVEEHSRRTVELGNDDSFGSVDYEGSGRSHVRNVPEEHVLDPGLKVFVVLVAA